ncbi:hypothetical protein P3T27_005858 [Kitasatospora sp. MAA19]|uniref:DUF2637 domain-containing protein n=1 Tax=unclassified Kitasatospora TaxID=2633591 RepID=UPI00247473AE|nr:DUF2637 domain-containing protein [Kitasatospora sp. MAA19]MDH6709112.1 hypothetical protein [Kitasatospora sp. MAA19]
MSTTTMPTTAPVTGWDRAVVIALGTAGCALSYDALQQMAVAIHVRGFLTYLFPLVIDGFISYGVRALLVLRDAPLRARIYVWTLFGAATGASLWANALHAVRMNEQSAATGLRLGDTVVAVLSTIAPLALAGAVHLYILIARGQVNWADSDGCGDRTADADRGQVTAEVDWVERPGPVTGGQGSTGHPGAGQPVSRPVTASEKRPMLTPVSPVSLTEPADLGGHPDTARPGTDRPADSGPVTAAQVSLAEVTGQPVTTPVAAPQVSDQEGDRRTDLDTEDLLKIARQAVKEEDKLTRKVVAQAIRGQQIPLSSDTLTQLMAQLRAQHGQPATADRD